MKRKEIYDKYKDIVDEMYMSKENGFVLKQQTNGETMRQINRVAVLGAGVMGATIAAHLANAGLEILLLDIVPRELSEEEKKRA